jgi:hypothetical protein
MIAKLSNWKPGESVDKATLEAAIEFLYSLEPDDPQSETADEEYRLAKERNKDMVERSNSVIRAYGEQIHPRTLENMQEAFYSITNSKKYLNNVGLCICARVSMTSAWHGIGDWQR